MLATWQRVLTIAAECSQIAKHELLWMICLLNYSQIQHIFISFIMLTWDDSMQISLTKKLSIMA